MLSLALERRLIVGHIPRELSKRLAFSKVEARGASDVLPAKIFVAVMALAFPTVLSG